MTQAIKRLRVTAAKPKEPKALFKKGDAVIIKYSSVGICPGVIAKDLFFDAKDNVWCYGYRRSDVPDKKIRYVAYNRVSKPATVKVDKMSPQTEQALKKMLTNIVKQGSPNPKMVTQLRKLADKFEAMSANQPKKVEELMPEAAKAVMKYARSPSLQAEDVKDGMLHITDDSALEDLVMDNGDKISDVLDEYMEYAQDPLQLLHDELRDFT